MLGGVIRTVEKIKPALHYKHTVTSIPMGESPKLFTAGSAEFWRSRIHTSTILIYHSTQTISLTVYCNKNQGQTPSSGCVIIPLN